jgi:hypothetical protein
VDFLGYALLDLSLGRPPERRGAHQLADSLARSSIEPTVAGSNHAANKVAVQVREEACDVCGRTVISVVLGQKIVYELRVIDRGGVEDRLSVSSERILQAQVGPMVDLVDHRV